MIIGFCGPIGAGKTLAAMHLVDHHGFQRRRFAGPLRAMLKALGLSDRELDGDMKMSPCALLGGKTPRQAMQTIGTEWGRDLIDPELWVRAWLQDISGFDRVVADDVRFPNECAAIRARGGVVIRIDRPGLVPDGHVSESHALPFDFAIRNDQSEAAFTAAIDYILGPLFFTGRSSADWI